LISGVNDSVKEAEELSIIFKNRLAHVNLIPYNPIDGVEYTKSDKNSIMKFKNILDKNNIYNTIRVTMGSDVNAACGQLAGIIN
jgi:23S rRNA (adenine2503-C2)-methyltransferase